MRKITIVRILFIAPAIAILVYVLYEYFTHDNLTQMQAFKAYWSHLMLSLLLYVIGASVEET